MKGHSANPGGNPWALALPTFILGVKNPEGSISQAETLNSKFPRFQLKVHTFFLWCIPIAILIGPRISVPIFESGDFRVQDFLVPVAALYFIACDFRYSNSNRRVFPAFFLWTTLVTASLAIMYFVSTYSQSITPFYLLRLIELPLIAVIIFRSLDAIGPRGLTSFVTASGLAMVANLGWIGTQALIRSNRPLWNINSSGIEQYGPGLLGEPGAFPAGQTLVILLAGVVSFRSIEILGTRYLNWFSSLIIVSLYASILATNSRVSILTGSAVFAFWCVLLVKKLSPHIRTSILASLPLAISAAVLSGVYLQRISWAQILQDIQFRADRFYTPLLSNLEESFWLGTGPGSGRILVGGEAHSLYLAIITDFGFIGFSAFLLGVFWIVRRFAHDLLNSSDLWLVVFSKWGLLITLNLLVAGAVQSSHMPPTPNHFAALVIGAYAWISTQQRDPRKPS